MKPNEIAGNGAAAVPEGMCAMSYSPADRTVELCFHTVPQMIAFKDSLLAAAAAANAQPAEPVAQAAETLSAMNDALCSFAHRWELDGDYLRCTKCKRPMIASRVGMAFVHADGCKAAGKVETHPWAALIELLRPLIASHPAAEPAQQPQEALPPLHAVVAGALFDLMGDLTSSPVVRTFSQAHEAGPAVEALTAFAKKRGLSLDYADVADWTAALSRAPVPEAGLTDEQIDGIWKEIEYAAQRSQDWPFASEKKKRNVFARAILAAAKEPR